MASRTPDLTIKQRATYKETITLQVNGSILDITGYTARLMARPSYGGAAVIDISTSSGITLVGNLGQVILNLTATQTAALDPSVILLYDLKLTSPAGFVSRPLEGKISVTPAVTL